MWHIFNKWALLVSWIPCISSSCSHDFLGAAVSKQDPQFARTLKSIAKWLCVPFLTELVQVYEDQVEIFNERLLQSVKLPQL